MTDQLTADVVIVGSGVAGSLMAAKLAEQKLSVLIIEAGPSVDRAKAMQRFFANPIKVPESPYEAAGHAPFPRSHQPDGYYVQAGPDRWGSTYLRVAGGTTWHWLGRTPRMLPEDFRMRSTFGVGVDWPIAYADLEPWYGKAEIELGVAGEEGDDHGSPRTAPYPMPPVPLSYSDQMIARALAARGGPQVTGFPHARNTVDRDGRPPCCGAANCVPICPTQAKYDATVHLDRAQALGARLMTEAVAHRVIVSADGRVEAIRFLRADGGEAEARGRAFVIAANAIETAKLLLMSATDRLPGGVANSSDQVGRNLMDHLAQVSWGLSVAPLWQQRGPKITAAVRIGRDGPDRAKRASFDTSLRNDGWDWGRASVADTAARLAREIADPAALDRAIADRVSRQLSISSDVEALPNPENRVIPDPELRDAAGLPRPRISFHLSEYERAGLAAARAAHETVFAAMACGEVAHADAYYGSGHLIGTCRMGADAKTSVTRDDLRTHDHPNLFLAGSGAFPTAGSANPTLTIAALVLRAVEAAALAARG
jgi:glucose dehydrogenase